MDTSITIVIIVGVLFVFILPSFLRRVDRMLTHGHVDHVPPTAQACSEAKVASCSRPGQGPQLYAASRAAADFSPPRPAFTAVAAAAELHLARPVPLLSVIDGDVADSAQRRDAYAADQHAGDPDSEVQMSVLPMAAGQTLPLTAHPDTMDATMTSSQTPSPVNATMQQRTPRDLPAHLRARSAQHRTGGSAAGSAVNPRGASLPSRPGEGTAGRDGLAASPAAHSATRMPQSAPRAATPGPVRGNAERDEAADRISRLKSVLPIVGLSFVVSALATLVTGILVLFGVLPWAVPVLTLALALGSFFLVRSINLSIRSLRRQPRGEGSSEVPLAKEVRGADEAAINESDHQHSTVDLSAIRAAFASGNKVDHGPGTPSPPESTGSHATGSHVAPAAPAHDASAAPADGVGADSVGGLHVQRVHERAMLNLKADEAQTASPAESAEAAGGSTACSDPSRVADPVANRIAADAWSPSPVPTPTYVNMPVVDRDQPAPVVPDATSFHLEAQTKEGLAQRFAAELGYRPELEDAAREVPQDAARKSAPADGPLVHGRVAIGQNRSRGVSRVDEVLARRRA